MSISDWKVREKEQRRNDIICAAQKLFASKGYESVSMDDIAEEIKLGKATLYRYFKSKQSLFFAVVLRGASIHHKMVMEKIKKAHTGAEQLAAVASASDEFRDKCPEFNQINNYYFSGRFDTVSLLKNNSTTDLPSSADDPAPGKITDTMDIEAVKKISQLQLDIHEMACSAIMAGREDGTIQPGLDPVELAILLSLTSSTLSNISPKYICLLEYRGISRERFIADSRSFLNQNVINNRK